MNDWLYWITTGATIIAGFVITCGLAQTTVYLLQLLLAAMALSSRPPVARATLLWRRYSDVAPPVALVVPAYNEEMNVVESVRSLLSLEYPAYEVIVVNDGSRDATLDRLKEAYQLRLVTRPYEEALSHAPIRGIYASQLSNRLFVVDKDNGGKADAQNAGINVSRAPLFCVIDADSILEPDALLRAVHPFVDDPVRTIAVGGTIRIANGSEVSGGRVSNVRLPRKLLPLLQIVEYLRAFLMARLAWSRINTLMLVSGAFGIFRRREAVEVGALQKAQWARILILSSSCIATCGTTTAITGLNLFRSPFAGPRRPDPLTFSAGSGRAGSGDHWKCFSATAQCCSIPAMAA